MSNSSELLEKHPVINWVIGNPFRQYPDMERSSEGDPTKAANEFAQSLEDEAINDVFNAVKNFIAGGFASLIPLVGPVATGVLWADAIIHLGRSAVETTQAIGTKRESSRRM